MAYTKQNWVDGDEATPLSAARLNHIEDGIAAKATKGDPGKPGADGKDGADGFPTQEQWDALVARVDALEGA